MILFVNQHESVLVDMVGTRKGARIELFYSVSECYPRLPDSLSYFRVFQMSTISHVFGLQL